MILEAIVEPKEDTQVDNKKRTRQRRLPIFKSLTEDVISQVAGCETAKELWHSLKTRHVGEEKVQQARLQSLMIGFNTLQMKEDEMVDAFTAKLNGYATKAITLDEISGKLKAFEERIKLWKGGQVESQENLLFAHFNTREKGRRISKTPRFKEPVGLSILETLRSISQAHTAWQEELTGSSC
ncbi:hypothetical protein Tco_1553698 [Tanacetum coccineum]